MDTGTYYQKLSTMTRRILLSTIFAFLCSISVSTQIHYTTAFQAKLQAAQLELLAPIAAGSTVRSPIRNSVQNYDHSIYSRKEKLEIRYLIIPYQENDPLADLPHVKSNQLMVNLSSNTEEFTGSAFSYTPEAAKSDFNADWASEFYFRTKKAFSNKENCKMLTIYREGWGIAHVFFLFDKIPPLLDARTISLRFLDNVD